MNISQFAALLEEHYIKFDRLFHTRRGVSWRSIVLADGRLRLLFTEEEEYIGAYSCVYGEVTLANGDKKYDIDSTLVPSIIEEWKQLDKRHVHNCINGKDMSTEQAAVKKAVQLAEEDRLEWDGEEATFGRYTIEVFHNTYVSEYALFVSEEGEDLLSVKITEEEYEAIKASRKRARLERVEGFVNAE